jgi:hypothetical protein
MAEFYANEIMSHPFTFNVYAGKSAKIGVAVDLTAAASAAAARGAAGAGVGGAGAVGTGAGLPVNDVKAWQMTLSSDQESLVGY